MGRRPHANGRLRPGFNRDSTGHVGASGAATSVRVAPLRVSYQRVAFGFLPQELALFQGTVAENVAFGLDHVDRGAVRRALLQVGGHRFLNELPHGLDTPAGERGTKLSGGQRQIIALARLFLWGSTDPNPRRAYRAP